MWTPVASVPQRPSFRTEVNYVELDVSVTAKDGSRVRGLTKDDFDVLENGKPQTVSAFQEVKLPMPLAPVAGIPRRLADPSVASNAGLSEGRVYVVVMDYGTLGAARSPRVRKQVAEFINDFMAPTDLAAVVSLGSTSRATEFTSNKARLLAAIRAMGDNVGSAADLADDVTPTASGLKADDEFADVVQAFADMIKSRMATDTTQRFRLLGRVAEFLKNFEGRRKALIYVSEGVDAEPPTGATQGLDQSAVANAMKNLTTSLVASNVTVYSIDPRGLSAIDPFGGSGYQAPMRHLRALADDTGGFATIGFNNLTDPFRRIVEDNSAYYVLCYATDQTLDG